MSNTAATTPPAAAPTMKLLVDTKSMRVFFAEAGKDVADFIFALLAMPVGAALLKDFGGEVKDIDALEERTVHVGNEEALRIVKAALHSRTVLTDAFIPQQGRGEEEGEGRRAAS
ncbi:unnamed protein product [Urochloa decumbens]|uniref:Uncharacterized protein n=1 Tax=Urochloa decumbens TaxID=240449 RepID=A0ABC8ZA06_9POAL